MTIAPKIKIASGIALSGGGAFELYKAFNPKNKNRIAHGVVGGILLLGGLLLVKKGWAQNKSLNAMPIQKETSENAEVKKIIADAVKEGKVSNVSGGQSAPVQSPAPSRPVQSKPQAQASHGNGIKVVGKIDMKRIEESKARKEKILKRIDQLKVQHDQVKKAKGWNAALPIRNEIEILKAQLFWC